MEMKIGDRLVGDGHPCYIIGEIGINHNGDLALANGLVEAAADAGCDAVKFQKRTPHECVPLDQWDKTKDTPWGEMRYIDYKARMEFDDIDYDRIEDECARQHIELVASCWDLPSLIFMEDYDPSFHKIASACVTDIQLMREYADRATIPVMISTGACTHKEIERVVEIFDQAGKGDKTILMHCNSSYPAAPEELNLNAIPALRARYGCLVGYSGHEAGLQTTVAAVTLGACVVERHITLDRTMWGSDHAASVEPQGMRQLVRDIRIVESALGDGVKRAYPGELEKMKTLRRV